MFILKISFSPVMDTANSTLISTSNSTLNGNLKNVYKETDSDLFFFGTGSLIISSISGHLLFIYYYYYYYYYYYFFNEFYELIAIALLFDIYHL